MLFLFALLFGGLFLGLILLAGRAFAQSETAVTLRQSICLSAGVRRKQGEH